MDYGLAMGAFLWSAFIFFTILGVGLTYIYRLACQGHLKQGLMWLVIMNLAFVLEASIYNLFLLLNGGPKGPEFWTALWVLIRLWVTVGIIGGGLAFCVGILVKKIKKVQVAPR